MGYILTIIIEDELFLLEFFKIFRIGMAWQNNEVGSASSLILGFLKAETNITFAWRRSLKWTDIGDA
tara:strand:+ start:103 stop:303 length:201 start_codon:yes stop_codon:yes gene_type:complete